MQKLLTRLKSTIKDSMLGARDFVVVVVRVHYVYGLRLSIGRTTVFIRGTSNPPSCQKSGFEIYCVDMPNQPRQQRDNTFHHAQKSRIGELLPQVGGAGWENACK